MRCPATLLVGLGSLFSAVSMLIDPPIHERRWLRSSLALVFAATLAACSVTPHAPRDHLEERAPAVEAGGTLRLLSWNTWSVPFRDDHRTMVRAAAEAIADVGADIVVLQEVWRDEDAAVFGEVLRDAGLPHQARRASSEPLNRGSSGLFIASRFPILRETFHPFRMGAAPRWPWPPDWYATKGALDVLLSTPEGPLRVVDTHLHAAYGRGGHPFLRLGQALELARALSPEGSTFAEPTILAGDLNTRPGELPYRVLSERLPVTVAARSGVDTLLTGASADTGLDLVAARVALTEPRPISSERTTTISDHPALLVELVRRPRAPAPHPGATPELRASVLEALLAASAEGREHQHVGMLAAPLLLVLALSLLVVAQRRPRRRRGALLMTALLATVLCWAAYHGWLLGPERLAALDVVRADVMGW